MALSDEQWQAIKADYEIGGLSLSAVARKHGVSKSQVSTRAKNERWQQGKTNEEVRDKVNSIIVLAETEQKTERLSPVERQAFDSRVSDELSFRLQNDERMEQVAKSAMRLLEQVEHPNELSAIMRVLVMQREAHLGKTVAKTQTTEQDSPQQIKRIIVDPRQS